MTLRRTLMSGMRSVLHALGIVVVTLLVAAPPIVSAANLSKDELKKLALLRVNDAPVVSLALLCAPGSGAKIAALAQRLGGRVRDRSMAVDFLSVVLPIDQTSGFLQDPAIVSVTIDMAGQDYQGDRMWFTANSPSDPPSGAVALNSTWPAVPADSPLDHPYPFLQDLGAEIFRAAHPSYDGRGVVVAHVESFGDFLLPELQSALDLQGQRIPKYRDVINIPAWQPSLDESPARTDWQWVLLSESVKTSGGDLQFRGQRYRVPHPGVYRLGELRIPNARLRAIGLLKEAAASKDAGHRNVSTKDSTAFAVLWSEESHTAWLDSQRKRDFANAVGVREFARSSQFGILGQDNPATPVRESLGYALQKDGDYLSFNFGVGDHASEVEGALAANRADHGRIDGIAPGAQILPINTGDTASAFAAAMIRAFTDARVDVVLVELYFPTMGNYNLNDGRSMFGLLLSRLVTRYRKPCFVTASNAPGLATADDAANAWNVMSVGAYQSAGSVLSNHGIHVAQPDSLHWVGAEGPAGDGTWKPDFLAPANPIVLKPRYMPADAFNGLYRFPVGYQLGSGTSTATPVASGAAALLISAAKQTGVAWNALEVYRAIKTSARYLPTIEAYQQGAGVLQVNDAWRQLQAQQHTAAPLAIEVAAPVRTATSRRLSVPDTGKGLFEREGWKAGDSAMRTVLLIRRSGSRQPLSLTTRLVGNDSDTFQVPERITLPLGKKTPLTVTVHPRTPGAHSATLQLILADSTLPALSLPLTVVAAHQFTAENGYSQAEEFEMERPGRRNLFFNVPENVAALSVSAEYDREWVIGRIYPPDNRLQTPYLIPNPLLGSRTLTLAWPMPGVWQVTFMDVGDSRKVDWGVFGKVLPKTKIKLQAQIFGSALSVAGPIVSVENRFAAFNGALAASALASLHQDTVALPPGGQKVYDLTVDAGALLLAADITPANSAVAELADADLYLYDCTTEKCVPARYSSSYGATERVLVEHPRAGHWRTVIVAAGGRDQQWVYRDYFTHPGLGRLAANDSEQMRAVGAHWSAQTQLWPGVAPQPGRQAAALMYVSDPSLLSAHRPMAPPTIPVFMPYGLTNYAEEVTPLGLNIDPLPSPCAPAGK